MVLPSTPGFLEEKTLAICEALCKFVYLKQRLCASKYSTTYSTMLIFICFPWAVNANVINTVLVLRLYIKSI